MKLPLAETGEHDAAEDASPEDMERLGQEPASKAWVINLCLRCWVKRWVRRMRLKWAFVLGSVFILTAGNVFIVRSVVQAVVRQTVIEVLKEHKLISAAPSPAAGESVASLFGGAQ